MSQKKLMLLGGIRYLLPVIKTAHEMGVYVITTDYLPNNIAHKYSDEYVNVRIIDALVAHKGVQDIDYTLYTRGEIQSHLKESRRMVSPRPRNVDPEQVWFYRAAWCLGKLVNDGKKDGAIFFHDPDHSRTGSRKTDIEIEDAMLSGFVAAECDTGVPMVPNPRSEAWLLAYFQKYEKGQTAYNKSERFERMPATDKSKNASKTKLQELLGCEKEEDVYPRVMEEIDEIDWMKISMPSFDRFSNRLFKLIDAVHSSQDHCKS